MRYSALQCVTVRYSALQCVTVRHVTLQCGERFEQSSSTERWVFRRSRLSSGVDGHGKDGRGERREEGGEMVGGSKDEREGERGGWREGGRDGEMEGLREGGVREGWRGREGIGKANTSIIIVILPPRYLLVPYSERSNTRPMHYKPVSKHLLGSLCRCCFLSI